MGRKEHEAAAADRRVPCAVVTCSDTRTLETDTSGAWIADALHDAGHDVVLREIIPDEAEPIRQAIRHPGAHAVLITGGTGLAERDRTIDVLQAEASRTIPGFGELFRMLSFEEIGPAAMASRAEAFVIDGRLVFAMPGSTAAVRLAMERLILPQLPHLVQILRGDHS